MSRRRRGIVLLLSVAGMLWAWMAPAAEPPAAVGEYLRAHCYDCHEGAGAEAGLDLSSLTADLADPAAELRWVRIWDRVHDGEMPPADAETPDPQVTQAFLHAAGEWIRGSQAARHAEVGRVQARRLTRREIERSLHDLLGIDIPLANQLPEEVRSSGFTTVAGGQAMSHFQMERHLGVVDTALEEAFRRALSPEDRYRKDFSAREVVRQDPRRRTREPEMLDGQAVVWSSGLIYYGRIPATTAPEDGWYRFTVTVSGLKPPKSGGVWSTVNSGLCVSSAPLLSHITAFEATAEPKTIEFEAWLPRRHMLEIRPGDTTLKKARFAGGQVGAGEGGPQDVPGIAIDGITMERVHRGADDAATRRLLFGDLPVEPDARGRNFQVASSTPHEDAARLIESFARRAFRRPVAKDQTAPYVAMAHAELDAGDDLPTALRTGYRALLCSPRFLYLAEAPGKLDDHAIAARLSFFLTGSTPDARLSELADAGRLHDPATLRAQADRLLAGEGGRRFVEDFAAEWLDLDQINFTEPDRKLYPQFDAIVQNSMLDETHTFLAAMLDENLSVGRLFDADFTFLNSRLARFYGIDGVEGDELRRTPLSPRDHRGGVVTQGAVLKVTANGSNTSPVVRGVWVSERLLGTPIPPPPDNVPAIEPDIRGATSIRDQLAKHREQQSCAVCHRKIDPPGFALENFDPAGQWRERYPAGDRRDAGPRIDASYILPDGREFQQGDEFRALVAAEPRKLAGNLAEKLLIYGTGAPLSFADREAAEQIADAAAGEEYGFRSLLYAVIASPVFLSK
jgi:hypothetical protein